MMQTKVAARYASALFAIAQETGRHDELEEQLHEVASVLEEHSDLVKLLNHPHVDKKDKKQLLLQIFSGQLSEEVTSLLQLLVDKNRQDVLPEVVQAYKVLANDARGIADATLTTVQEVDAQTVEKIKQQFTKVVGKEVRLQTEIDKELLGGFVVRIGDRIYDGSVKSQLERFQKSLKLA